MLHEIIASIPWPDMSAPIDPNTPEIKPLMGWGAIFGFFVWLGLGTIGATVATIVVEGAVVIGSAVYARSAQRKQQAAARAAAARAQRQAQAAIAAQQKQLRDLSKLSSLENLNAGPQDVTLMIKRSVVNRRFVYGRARVGGIWLYVETTGANNDIVHMILGLCEGPIEEIGDIYFDDQIVTVDAAGDGTGKWSGVMHISRHLGSEDQVAEPLLVTASAGKWTDAHTLKGIAYLYVKLVHNIDIFPSIPEISAVIKGKNDIRDPRTSTPAYTDNAALCLADYLTTPLRGPGIPWEEIDEGALTHAADVCDQAVELLSGGSEPRYTVSGAIDLANSIEDNNDVLIQAMAGDMIFQNGLWEIQAGEYRTPTFEITADMMVEGFSISHLQPRKDRINVVKGTFVSEANRWQRFDFPSVTRAIYVNEDGMENVRDLTLEMVASGSQAQRLASIELEQTRRSRTLSCTCNLRALPARVGGSVLVTLARHFDRQPMRVISSVFVVSNDGALLLKLSMTETDEDIYAWSRTREQQLNTPPAINATGVKVATPLLSPDPGEYSTGLFPLAVSITTLTSGATIRYSLTALPTTITEGSLYSAPFNVADGDTVYARAFKTGIAASEPAIGAYIAV